MTIADSDSSGFDNRFKRKALPDSEVVKGKLAFYMVTATLYIVASLITFTVTFMGSLTLSLTVFGLPPTRENAWAWQISFAVSCLVGLVSTLIVVYYLTKSLK